MVRLRVVKSDPFEKRAIILFNVGKMQTSRPRISEIERSEGCSAESAEEVEFSSRDGGRPPPI